MNGMRFLHRSVAIARGAGWGRNSLRRRTDRIESVGVLAAVVIAAASIPVATAVGTATYHRGLAVSARQTAAAVATEAVLLDDAPVLIGSGGPAGTVSVPGRWTTPDGARRVGMVQAAESARAGSTVRIWTDATGALIRPPLSPDQAWTRGGFTTICLLFGVFSALALGLLVLRWKLDRARDAELDAEWREVAPRWTRRA